jgi:hypothetical protein
MYASEGEEGVLEGVVEEPEPIGMLTRLIAE